MLNKYLPVVVQAAQKHGGNVNKFGGDSTLIVYGAPRKMKDSAYHAVLTALDIRMGVKTLNEKLAEKLEAPLRFGVGINTGNALAGAVGTLDRQEYTVIGKTVNLAARIDGLNKQFPNDDILISEWTYEALGEHRDEFDLVSLGAVPIRGKNEPVEIWSVKNRH
jgi:adenylate cyclase